MPNRHFLRRDYLHIFFYLKFLVFVFFSPSNKLVFKPPFSPIVDFDSQKKKNTISQMRLRSVFKMRTSILNTATTEQMGYGIFSFFVSLIYQIKYFCVIIFL